ncbi:MAG: hypothetical protein AAGB31_09895 [Bdellovibrio sp.]
MVLVTQRVSESTVKLEPKLKMRCPSCSKLYEVATEDIQSETPVFQCFQCKTHFGFEFPPTDPNKVHCYAVSAAKQHSEPVVVEAVSEAMKSCPKCGALNGRGAQECYSCHVIFQKLEGLPQDTSLRAQPSLVRKWKNLLENFANEDLHNEFIQACHQLDALRFAVMKYEDLKAAQGGDPVCEAMLARIQSLMMVGLSAQEAEKNKVSATGKWRKYFYWGPFSLSALMILLGMINLGHRNLIGVGVALAFMAAGLIIMIRGKISLSDFLD